MRKRVREVGGRLGYRVEEGKGGSSVGLGKGRVVLLIGVLEMAPGLVFVEVKVVEGGVEFEEFQWMDLKAGLDDIVVAWHNDINVM